ncbi:uncharacterized protein LOC114247720 [Bombyx mandarina]|uniref:Uncharacterized protein LOC114247720 n=1 Tax=Bombyx mandarina TaxID=7092 RepID=A0A6J2K4L4_BOMMA|nr:uncharacterized protein LOC114247720 [Bombyx mandarina]
MAHSTCPTLQNVVTVAITSTMYRYVAIAFYLVFTAVTDIDTSPVRVTIDCTSESKERESLIGRSHFKRRLNSDAISKDRFDVDTFCDFIHSAIPKSVRNGKFISNEYEIDQYGFSDTQIPTAVAPPRGFVPSIPKLKLPKLKVPVIKVPKLKSSYANISPPIIKTPVFLPTIREIDEESSAEKMEKFKKGIQKMLHVVKVLGQIDQYLSERTRIVIDKLSKTLAD